MIVTYLKVIFKSGVRKQKIDFRMLSVILKILNVYSLGDCSKLQKDDNDSLGFFLTTAVNLQRFRIVRN